MILTEAIQCTVVSSRIWWPFYSGAKSTHRDNSLQYVPDHPRLLQTHFLQESANRHGNEYKMMILHEGYQNRNTINSLGYAIRNVSNWIKQHEPQFYRWLPQPFQLHWVEDAKSHRKCWQQSMYFSQTTRQLYPVNRIFLVHTTW